MFGANKAREENISCLGVYSVVLRVGTLYIGRDGQNESAQRLQKLNSERED